MDFSSMVRQPRSTQSKQIPRSTPEKRAIVWPNSVNSEDKRIVVLKTKEELQRELYNAIARSIFSFDWETAPTDFAIDKYIELIEQASARKKFAATKTLLNKIEKEIDGLKEQALKLALDPQASDICTFSFSYQPNESFVVYLDHKKGTNIDCGKEEALMLLNDQIFKNADIMKIAYNLAFESKFSAKRKHYIVGNCADPMMMIIRVLQVISPDEVNPDSPFTGKGLKAMASKYLGFKMSNFQEVLDAQEAEFFNECDTENPLTAEYSGEDSDASLQLYLMFKEVAEQITTDSLVCPTYNDWLHMIDMPFTRVTALMEYNGLSWDNEEAAEKAVYAENKILEEKQKIMELGKKYGVEVDPGETGKTGAVSNFLFTTLRAPEAEVSEKTGKPSLSYEALLDIKFMVENGLIDINEEDEFMLEPHLFDPNKHKYKDDILVLLQSLISMATMTTLLSTHIKGRQKWINMFSNKIHAKYEPWCDTGRLSSSCPNGQNVPRPENDEFGVRNLYDVPKGKVMVLVDFSGFELRLIAWKSGDEVMTDLFNNHGDMHMKTAMTLTGKPADQVTKSERAAGKTGNFSVTYGGTKYSLRTTFKTQYNIRHSLDYCEDIIQAIYKAYPGIPRFQEEAAEYAREHGYIETIYGFRRLLPYINSATRSYKNADERKAANTPIQGSAADIMKKCQNKIYDELGKGLLPGVDMCAQIHDEILFICDDDITVVSRLHDTLKLIMEAPPLPNFPVKIEVEVSVAYKWGKKMSYTKWMAEKQNV